MSTLLYPVDVAGNALSALASPEEWAGSLGTTKESFITPLPDEYQRHLMRTGVLVDRESLEPQTLFRARSYRFNEPAASLMRETEEATAARFTWFIDLTRPVLVTALPMGVLVINPRLLGTRSAWAEFFEAVHEASHHVLGHTEGADWRTGRSWSTLERTLNADAVTAEQFLQLDCPSHLIELAVMEQAADDSSKRDLRLEGVRQFIKTWKKE